MTLVELKNREIFLQFKLGDMGSILIPFDFFILNKFLKDVISQCFLDQFTLLRKLNRLQKVPWKRVDPVFLPCLLGHLKDVLFNGRRKFITLFNPL